MDEGLDLSGRSSALVSFTLLLSCVPVLICKYIQNNRALDWNYPCSHLRLLLEPIQFEQFNLIYDAAED